LVHLPHFCAKDLYQSFSVVVYTAAIVEVESPQEKEREIKRRLFAR